MSQPLSAPGPLGLLIAVAGCGVPASNLSADAACVFARPDRGVITAPVACAQQVPEGQAAAVRDDLWIATPWLRAVIRAPERSLSLPGLGGGTIVDAAPWQGRDGLVEVVALMGGGGLDVRDATTDPEGMTLHGVPVALPGRQLLPTAPTEATFRWTADPEGPWLIAEGAEGLYLHATSDAELIDGWLRVGNTVYGHDGYGVRDLGGAILADGAHRLLVAPLHEAWGMRPAGPRLVSGTTSRAAEIEAWRDDTKVGVLVPDEDGRFEGAVPADTTHLLATAPGFAPSEPVAPGVDLDLTPGPTGGVRILLAWPAGLAPRPVRLGWENGGRSGSVRLSPSGDLVALPPGSTRLKVDGGPTLAPSATTLDVPEAGITRLRIGLQPAVTPPPGIHLAALGVRDGRGSRLRSPTVDVLRREVGEGRSLVLLADDHLAGRTSLYVDDAAWVHTLGGTTLRHPDGGVVTAWPWSSNASVSATDIPRISAGATLDETLRQVVGPLSSPRHTIVDLDLLAHRSRPWSELAAQPALVRLPSPGPAPFDAWGPWLETFSLASPPGPAGPLAWVAAEGTADDPDPVALEIALKEQHLTATTGPFLWLQITGTGPGGVVSTTDTDDDLPHFVEIQLDARGTGIDRVSLVGPEGLLRTWTVSPDTPWYQPVVRALPRVVTVIAWSTTEPDTWAVTAPTLVRGPPGSQPVDTALPEDSP